MSSLIITTMIDKMIRTVVIIVQLRGVVINVDLTIVIEILILETKNTA